MARIIPTPPSSGSNTKHRLRTHADVYRLFAAKLCVMNTDHGRNILTHCHINWQHTSTNVSWLCPVHGTMHSWYAWAFMSSKIHIYLSFYTSPPPSRLVVVVHFCFCFVLLPSTCFYNNLKLHIAIVNVYVTLFLLVGSTRICIGILLLCFLYLLFVLALT